MVEALLSESFVPNDIALSSAEDRECCLSNWWSIRLQSCSHTLRCCVRACRGAFHDHHGPKHGRQIVVHPAVCPHPHHVSLLPRLPVWLHWFAIHCRAQIGSFVPADEAEIGVFDAVYTR